MTVTEIARLTGTSKATVSRVLNGHVGVSSKKVRIVQEAAKTLGYVAPKRGRNSGLQTGNIAALALNQEMFSEGPVMSGVRLAAAERGLNLIVGLAANLEQLPPLVAKGAVDGVILWGPRPNPEVLARLERFPSIWVSSYWTEEGGHVLPGNEAISSLAVDYLLDRGHKNLAFLNVYTESVSMVARGEYFEFLAQRGGATPHMFTEDLVHVGDNSIASLDRLIESVERQVDSMLQLSGKITGLFVPASFLVPVVYRAFMKRGVMIGKDIDVVTVGSEEAVKFMYPRPAVVDIGLRTMGRRAVEMLLCLISDTSNSRQVYVMVESKLVPGEDPGLKP